MSERKKLPFHYALVVTYEVILSTLLALPRYRSLNALKAAYLRLLGAKVGRRVVLYPGLWIMPASSVTLGDDVDLALDVSITGKAPIHIGDRTLVGYGTRIISSNHVVPARGRIFDSGHEHAPVTIGEDCWIGANCVILPGVIVGDHAVVAAGAVVTKDVAPRTIVGGVPASPIAQRGRP